MQSTVVTFTVSLFISTIFVNATPLLRELNPRSSVAIPGYVYNGCYTEATGQRALTGYAYYDDSMTVEKCAAACSTFAWFGVEYGRECYCGNSPNLGSVSTSETECSFSCPGNSAETCGAGNRLNMYSAAVVKQISPTYSQLGCYTEASNGRALNSYSIADDAMTVEKCAAACTGHWMFGVEWHRECYCGDELMPGSVPASSTDCKYSCVGNDSELCGGDWRLNVYQFGATIVTTVSSSPSSTIPSTTSGSTSKTSCTSSTHSTTSTTSSQSSTSHTSTSSASLPTSTSHSSTNSSPTSSTYSSTSSSALSPTPSSSSSSTSHSLTSSSSTHTSTLSSASASSSSSTSHTSTSSSSTQSSILGSTSSSSTSSSTSSSSSSASHTTTSSTPTSTSTSSSFSSSASSSSVSISSSSILSSSSSVYTPTSTSTSSSSSASSSLSTTSFSSTTSSSTTLSTSSTTTSAGFSCKTPLLDPSFEETDPANIPWIIKYNFPWITYNFATLGTSTIPTYDGGAQQASVIFSKATTSPFSWFTQVITVCPNTMYNLSAWSKYVGTQYLTCDIDYFVSDVGYTTVLGIMSVKPVYLNGIWVQNTGTYTSDASTTQVAFNVRVICPSNYDPYGRAFYMDAISFVAAS
ncbi:WSC-domain-containing protein [Stipitochalara longipes BDJ]|nr:WSC-domain-containing protein [Stipitochalara longipes BDJ]